MSLRLLYLTPGCFDKGGISRYSRYQIEAFRRICAPNNVRVLSLLGPQDDAFEAPFEVCWHGKGRFGQLSLANRAAYSARALGMAAMWRPDLILSAHVNLTPLMSVCARLCGAKTVLNVYGLEIWSDFGGARRAHMQSTDHIISDCNFTARYVSEEGLHQAAPTVIWDPVDLERFSPGPASPDVMAKYGLPDPSGHFIVMSFGRLAKAAAHKGFDRLIETVATLKAEAPALRLVIAGRGDDRPRLEELVRTHAVGDIVVFTGIVDEADLAPLYRCAHVFSLVSDRGHLRGEGIPLTPLEAMACGVPLIVGNEDGSQEVIVDGRNGFVVSPRRPEEQRAALRQLMGDPEARARIGQQARSVAMEHFGFDRFVAQHRAFLSGLGTKREAAPRIVEHAS